MAVRIEPEEHEWNSKVYVDRWIDSSRTRDERRVPLLRKMLSFIPKSPDAPLRVLDVGGGYGLLSQQVLELFPKATVVLHDYSEPMFDYSRQRLTWAGNRVSFVKADLFDPGWNKVPDGQFDAVVSAIAIHNLRDPKRIRAVYSEILPLVTQGGCFLNYDRIPAPPGPVDYAYRHAALVAEQQRIKADTGQEKSLAEVQDLMIRAHRIEPRELPAGEPATLENQLRWLREAGFAASDCIWKDMQNAIFGGFRD